MYDSQGVHPLAARGFGAEAETYALARPSYPEACAGWLRELGLGPGAVALEVGAGTGKFTGRLLETGARVIAVEPVEEMRARLLASFPIQALGDTAQSLSVSDQSVDAVVCAQSFHWFATEETVREFARVLKAGGRVGLVWNQRDEEVDWVRELAEMMEPYSSAVPHQVVEAMEPLFVGAGFGRMLLTEVRHEHRGPAELVVVQAMKSRSFVAALPVREQEELLGRVRALLESHGHLRGEVAFPYVTRMLSFRRGLGEIGGKGEG